MRASLDQMLAAIGTRDAAPEYLFVGDYINRGPESRQVVELMLTLPSVRLVRGNHDDVFDWVLNGQSFVAYSAQQDRIRMLLWFMQEGMDDTLMSYGTTAKQIDKFVRHPNLERLEELIAPIPASHRAFFRDLPFAIEQDDIFVAHASWPVDCSTCDPDIAARVINDLPLRAHLLWNRFSTNDLESAKAWKRRGFFGHTPVVHYPWTLRSRDNIPIQLPHCVLIDTGIGLGAVGRLTAYCVEENRYIQIDRKGQILEGT